MRPGILRKIMRVPQINPSYNYDIDLPPSKAKEIAEAMDISLEEAKALIQRCISDPIAFQKQQRFIEQMKREPDKRPVKAWQLRHTEKSIGRNSPCPCGSGKKFKKCCIKKERYLGVIVHRGEIEEHTTRKYKKYR